MKAVRVMRSKKPSDRRKPAWTDVLRSAIQAHQKGDLAAAERLYKRVLALCPDQPDALHFHGVLCHQQGRSDEAVTYIGRALEQIPDHPDVHSNLGNVHKECGRLAEAARCYERALECSPGHYQALSNLGVVREAQERPEEAFQAYDAALRKVPDFALGHHLMAMFLRNYAQSRSDIERATVHFRRAFELDPRNIRALEGLGVVLYTLGRHAEASEVYRDWLVRDPDHPVARHMLAACGAEAVPARCHDDYVRTVFDDFADSFDAQLLNNLGYRVPELIGRALEPLLPATGGWDVLDAGCGTGLCAPYLRPCARRLEGVDLSPGMIAKAKVRGGYDLLEVGELTAFMRDRPGRYDAVVLADTLVYFGDLEEVLARSWGALRPGGWLAFSVEALPGDGDRTELSVSGRYRHGRAYLERCLGSAGFAAASLRGDVLRQEGGKPVNGWVVLAQRPMSG